MTEPQNRYVDGSGTIFEVTSAGIDPVTGRPRCWLETDSGERCSISRAALVRAVSDGRWEVVEA